MIGWQRVPQVPHRKGGLLAIDLLRPVSGDLRVASGGPTQEGEAGTGRTAREREREGGREEGRKGQTALGLHSEAEPEAPRRRQDNSDSALTRGQSRGCKVARLCERSPNPASKPIWLIILRLFLRRRNKTGSRPRT
ncbi:hypothetical protein EYF80_050534 [Liparis tanakae]|uniref:Uncharacterized protein n=1 Tax=Liparis tanakae TaxID=230148 RepID=A0A4Z2FFW9_9TELE|nr:hypothetical protein EYF80_050534 [Liparis tanakae]